ncbi:MAG: hypothetical protein J7647_29910 [Cyanobacteria bacterium SBLK]|nr:hypothetical protein [Cyanobacteria bacterium SBLK]
MRRKGTRSTNIEGRLESVTDALNQTTTYEDNDPFGRITKITLPDTSQSSTYTGKKTLS